MLYHTHTILCLKQLAVSIEAQFLWAFKQKKAAALNILRVALLRESFSALCLPTIAKLNRMV